MNLMEASSSGLTTSMNLVVMMALMCSRLTTMDLSRHRMQDGYVA